MMTQVTAPDQEQEKTSVRTLMAMTALTLAILATLGAWQVARDTAAPRPEATQDAALASPAGATMATPMRLGVTVYLVASEEERASVHGSLDLANAERMPEAPLAWLVVDMSAPGAEQLAHTIAADANIVRDDGRPALTLIDLRASTSGR